MDVIRVWAWMHWPMDGLVAWTLARLDQTIPPCPCMPADKVRQTRAIDPLRSIIRKDLYDMVRNIIKMLESASRA